MSRRECKHAKSCGHEWCYLEDEACIVPPCDEFVDSGWRRPLPRPVAVVRASIEKARARVAAMRPEFGKREKFEQKMLGYRGVLARLANEMELSIMRESWQEARKCAP